MIKTIVVYCFLVFFFISCIKLGKKDTLSTADMPINLYSGIRNFVSLGDTESVVLNRVSYSYSKEQIQEDTMGRTLKSVDIDYSLFFKDVGITAYFRKGNVVLIEIQDPFQGYIQGKNFRVFQFKLPEGSSWEDVILKIFGPPQARASGGSLGSEGLFYDWGDISYNRMGCNQLAIYRDPAISRYRLKFFGRQLRLFNN